MDLPLSDLINKLSRNLAIDSPGFCFDTESDLHALAV